MDAMKVGRFILEKRRELNITQKDLAEKLYITDKAVSKWERGISLPDISIIIPLSEVLNVNLYDLLTGGKENE